MQNFKRVLVANRGEIAIRVFRACHELGIRTVAIYSEEDKGSLFRTKADESYQVGKGKSPIDAYLNIEEIIQLAKKKGVDAIHPGYGFLSENPEFSKKCEEAGIVFIGPNSVMMNNLGDKIKSKQVAIRVGVPVIPGIEKPILTDEEAIEAAQQCGYPVILKASAGGGGRGMRIVRHPSEIVREYQSAKSEAKKAFGIDDIFVEKYLESPKHIEVQVLGDNFGNLVHLYERDCSIQRRHQKVVEYTPAFTLSEEKRQAICADALKISAAVSYRNAGTCEFLVDKNGDHYFIEMNPRIQVEHTITEMYTGIDIVQCQILIAQGFALNSDEVGIPSQESIIPRGFSIQCRITTEDPTNNFAPDTGRIDVYRSGSGFGIRLDGGNGFTGAVISPYYDSLLVKSISHSRTWEDTVRKSLRALGEMKIQGVKTNIGFLINVLNHEQFIKGECNTNFIAENRSLFEISPKADVEYKILSFIGEKVVNETKGEKEEFNVPRIPNYDKDVQKNQLYGTKQILDTQGAKGLVDWIHGQKKLLITDTTMRDAQQSLIATRMRTVDIKKVASATAQHAGDLFSLEMWGGATFDVAYRYLNESPWERLDVLREKIPNVLFQMLIRGANTVGYKNYPDNVVRAFIKESAKRGIDVFRIFDSLNWQKGMEIAIDEVLNNGKVAEASICYTGDILNEYRDKYSLQYYVDKAKMLEKTGAHILCIKDMSALLKPYAATKLIHALKNEISMPVHLHTHDTTGNGVSTILMAAEAGVDIIDTAMSSMSGLTSQPALNAVVAALEYTNRDTGFDLGRLQEVSDYWQDVRPVYKQFESDLKSTSAEIYKYEIPGGQYSNLKPQVDSFGLGHRFGEVKEMFKKVNDIFGDIVKVTPSSKAVGDMAIFMVQNELTPENLMEKGADLAFPDSVYSYFQGMMGQPDGGFPLELQRIVLKGEEPITCRPGELLPPEDFEAIKVKLETTYKRTFEMDEILSYALYPKVFEDYLKYRAEHGDMSRIGSDVFFHGMYEGETCEVEIASGKKLIVRLLEIGNVNSVGQVKLTYDVNGNRREVLIKDKGSKFESVIQESIMADPESKYEVGSSIPGKVFKVLVKVGESVKENQVVAIVEAMKMETSVVVLVDGIVTEIHAKEGMIVKSGELLMKLEKL